MPQRNGSSYESELADNAQSWNSRGAAQSAFLRAPASKSAEYLSLGTREEKRLFKQKWASEELTKLKKTKEAILTDKTAKFTDNDLYTPGQLVTKAGLSEKEKDDYIKFCDSEAADRVVWEDGLWKYYWSQKHHQASQEQEKKIKFQYEAAEPEEPQKDPKRKPPGKKGKGTTSNTGEEGAQAAKKLKRSSSGIIADSSLKEAAQAIRSLKAKYDSLMSRMKGLQALIKQSDNLETLKNGQEFKDLKSLMEEADKLAAAEGLWPQILATARVEALKPPGSSDRDFVKSLQEQENTVGAFIKKATASMDILTQAARALGSKNTAPSSSA